MKKQPSLIPEGATADIVDSQLAHVQTAILEKRLPEADQLVKRWALLAKQDEDTKIDCMVLLNLLVVPHSSVSCERVFSYVRKIKTDQRGSMGDFLLEALINVKHMPGSPILRKHSSDTLKFFRVYMLLVTISTCYFSNFQSVTSVTLRALLQLQLYLHDT